MDRQTLEMIKNLTLLKPRPDVLIEIDKSLCTVVFQHKNSPYYTRKFRSDDNEALLNEISKTFDFVSKTYPTETKSFGLISTQGNNGALREKLMQMKLTDIPVNEPQRMILPC